MDIYFCDLCGVRVTDADLRAGHGLRDEHDIICSNCLELGHHKEWLNRRKSQSHDAAAAGTKTPSRDAVDLLATLEESETPPRADASESSPSHFLPVLPEDHTATASLQTPGKPSEMPLAGAASLFSALSNPFSATDSSGKAISKPHDDDEDDLLDQDDDLPATSTPEPASSPFADTVSDDQEKAETSLLAARKGDKAESSAASSETAEKPATRKAGQPTPSPSSRPKSEVREVRKATSARHGKAGGRSSRRVSSGADASRMILFGSVISIILILFVGVFVVGNKKHWFGAKPVKAAVGIDGDEIKSMISSTKTKVIDALHSEQIPQLQAAKAEIEHTQSAIDAFEQTAVRSGNSEAQINHFLEKDAGWNDVYMLKRNVNDMIQRLSH